MKRRWRRPAAAARLPVMPIHSAMSSRFPLLEGVPSMQALVEDPQYAQVRAQFESHPDYQVPDVRVRSDAVPGPHGAGARPDLRRRRRRAQAGPRPALVWMHGGAFIAGNLDMPEADWTSRELARRAGAVVVSVDYRLCKDGVHYPVPHDDVVAAVRWVRDNASSLGIDPGRVCVGGASAGANLAAGAALQAPRRRRAAARAADLRLRRGPLRSSRRCRPTTPR